MITTKNLVLLAIKMIKQQFFAVDSFATKDTIYFYKKTTNY
jgi:hypothetical protein